MEDKDLSDFLNTIDTSIKSLEEILNELRETISKECIVCCGEFKCMYINDDIATIHDLDENIPENKLFISCCCNDEHLLCKPCLKKLALNFDNHMINKNECLMYCPATSGCVTPVGTKNYFDHHLIKKVLTPTEYIEYQNYAYRFAFTGFQIVKCKTCEVDNIIPEEYFKDADIGRLLIRCSQSRDCDSVFCYTCGLDVHHARNACPDCESKTENTNPASFNRYFYKPENFRLTSFSSDEEKYFFRNYQLTNDIILSQLLEVINNDYVVCPVCLTKIFKTEKCNCMDHCGVEFCYACNRKTIGKLENHWSEIGREGCFRFDSATIVKDNVPDFVCVEDMCYNHEKGCCKEEHHQKGIEELNFFRKKGMVYHMIKSLVGEKPDQILDIIKNTEQYSELRKYIPSSFEHNNYFDYLPFQIDKSRVFNRFLPLLDIGGEDTQTPVVNSLSEAMDIIRDGLLSTDSMPLISDYDEEQRHNILHRMSDYINRRFRLPVVEQFDNILGYSQIDEESSDDETLVNSSDEEGMDLEN